MKRFCLLYSLVVVCGAMSARAEGSMNLLKNPGFEDAGSLDQHALHWRMNEPDDHGDAWGTSFRAEWRAHEGRFAGAVRGTWASLGDYGGFWQEVPGAAGEAYKATAWFWADAGWIAETQELKIEFWDAERTTMLGSESVPLHDVGEIWVQKEVEGRAPENTAWVRVVIHVGVAGQSGSLLVDEVSLEKSW